MAESIKAQLKDLYRAGKVQFPQRANEIAAITKVIGDAHAAWHEPTIRAGEPAALVKAMEVNAEVYDLLRRAVLTWHDAAHALVYIADELVASDEAAREAAATLKNQLGSKDMPPLHVPPRRDGAGS
ncbi:hypothetical protein [Nocardioides marmotae]|uniref:Uncharacterized protein n=1 Tax=Nocardioides marmotae TaxID=2663857 RepID=A0A6I3JBI5_9ACTN|nr:hypothetical protein [Nocardioides marmotae]MCR6031846.1 hypothetical protein [Gordonia jinghuaiqii]MBC9732208.1 hypothetical protein [Nocardioides marmotae]MTB83330.1 hypothetical protein [Nocardioides marmotae]MTB95487.1 hypothetical protein [Nocardioides marmotae]QKE00919.1 hypothetical protein HPC71_07425 [Nocardioides marmotae]